MPLKSAKILFLISFIYLPLGFGDSRIPIPKMECGTYLAHGVMGQNRNGDFILVLHKGTYSPFELILLGGGIGEKRKHLNHRVGVKFYVPNPIKDQNRTYVFLKTIEHPQRTLLRLPIPKLLSKGKCRDPKEMPTVF